jgi:glycosyltransferase involved in cell wall biosynthesis
LLAKYTRAWDKRQEDKVVDQASNCDIVSIIKSPGIQLYQRLRELNGPRVIMDINDAVWLPAFKWADLPETVAMVHAVICENEYVAAYAHQFNSRIFVIPDSPQVEIFDLFRDRVRRNSRQVVLGWIGGSQNIGPLLKILEPLESLFARYPQLHLRVVGADRSKLPKMKYVRYSCRPAFSQIDMVREVLAFDIGLFPLLHDDDGRARGTLKALVYMSGEAAVVGENFGENPKLIQDGVNGVLASSPHEWHEKLEYLITNAGQRSALAKCGLETVRKRFTAGHTFERLIAAYTSVLN